MKKLLSILSVTTLLSSIPAPLLANRTLERAKRDVGTSEKDVTTGFDIKIKEKYSKDNFNFVENSWWNKKIINMTIWKLILCKIMILL